MTCYHFKSIGGHLTSLWPKMQPQMTSWPQKLMFHSLFRVTYKMKYKDSRSWPVNILNQYEVIWPCMTKNATSDDLNDHNMNDDRYTTKVIIFHLICHSTLVIKHSFFVAMEVIWGHILCHSEVNWHPIDLRWFQVNFWST